MFLAFAIVHQGFTVPQLFLKHSTMPRSVRPAHGVILALGLRVQRISLFLLFTTAPPQGVSPPNLGGA